MWKSGNTEGELVGGSIAQLTTFALGAAASPLPVVAVLIMLLTKRAKPGSIVMAICWALGNVTVIAIAIAFSKSLQPPARGLDPATEGTIALVIGVSLVIMGLVARRSRAHGNHETTVPKWVDSVDSLSPAGGGTLAFLNATTSPKNLALAITAGRLIAESTKSVPVMFASGLYYALIASLSIVVPVLFYFIGGERSIATLSRWRQLVTANAAAVMEIILLVLGIVLSLKGVFNLLA